MRRGPVRFGAPNPVHRLVPLLHAPATTKPALSAVFCQGLRGGCPGKQANRKKVRLMVCKPASGPIWPGRERPGARARCIIGGVSFAGLGAHTIFLRQVRFLAADTIACGRHNDKNRTSEVVRRCHQGQQRPRPGTGRIRPKEPQADRSLAQTFGRNKSPKEDGCLSLGAFDAHILHQSRRHQSFGGAAPHFDARQGRTAQAVRT
jgi:hypothetical protein